MRKSYLIREVLCKAPPTGSALSYRRALIAPQVAARVIHHSVAPSSIKNLPKNQIRAADNNDEQRDRKDEGKNYLQNLEENQDTYNKDEDPE